MIPWQQVAPIVPINIHAPSRRPESELPWRPEKLED